MIVLENHTESTCGRRSTKQDEESPKETTPRRFDHYYVIRDRLHRGTYGSVYITSQILHPEELYAVKVIDRRGLKARDDKGVFREAVIMKEVSQLGHASHLVDFFVTEERFYIVLELATGGDMFDWIAKHGPFKEADARKLAVQLLETIQAFHRMRIVHRDLKPENILLEMADDNTSIQIADWGFAAHLPEGKMLSRRCGTTAYIAPEIVSGQPYDERVDFWSLGCLLYMSLCGYPPFYGRNTQERFMKIRLGDYRFHQTYWSGVSPEAKEVIRGLLMVDPKQRWAAEKALHSAWLKDCLQEVCL